MKNVKGKQRKERMKVKKLTGLIAGYKETMSKRFKKHENCDTWKFFIK